MMKRLLYIPLISLVFSIPSSAVTFTILKSIAKPVVDKILGRDVQCRALCTPTLCKLSGDDSRVIKVLGKPLRNDRVVSWCKGMCQTTEVVKGYRIKKRYGKGWDLMGCVKAGQEADLSSSKNDSKSIAVYNDDQYAEVKGLIINGSESNRRVIEKKRMNGEFGPQ